MSASAMNASGLGPSPWGAPRSAVNPVMADFVLVRWSMCEWFLLVLKQLSATDSDAGVRGIIIPSSSMLPSHRATSGGTPPRSHTITCASRVRVSKALLRSKDAI